MVAHAILRDGSEVLIRRITPADAPMLAEGFQRLSRESRQLRFLTAKSQLSVRELRYLTDVDGHEHEALGALDPVTGEGVGVARFARLEQGGRVADVAVTVADAWQRRGLGTLLLEALTDRARAEGITRYTALVSGENRAALQLLRSLGAHVRHSNSHAGAVEYEIDIAPAGLGRSLRSALRAAASGHISPPKRITDALSALVHAGAQLSRQPRTPPDPRA